MYFIEAVRAMKEGKKAKRPHHPDWLIINEGKYIVWENNDYAPHLSTDSYLIDDWEIYEEKFCLSDKIRIALNHINRGELVIMGNPTQDKIDKFCKRGFISVDSFKQFIQELKDKISDDACCTNNISLYIKIIDELAGDKLI
jgi:hypothetical protein